jgi:predicted Zn-dependent protease
MALHPTDKAGLRMQVKSLMAESDTKGAIAAAEAAHAGDPADNDMTALLAALYIGHQQAGDAVSLLDRVEGGATGQLATLRGQAMIAAGKYADAATVLQAAIAAAPKDLRPRIALAQLDIRQQNPDAARTVLTDGLTAVPGNFPLMQTLVGIDLKQHGIKAALATADALQKDPDNLPAARLLPGGVLAASGDLNGAAAAFVTAYQQAPSSQLALAAASALVKAGKPKDGQKLLQDWSDKHPDDAAPLQVLASMAILDHRLDDARTLLERVLKLLPDNAVALNNLAWVKLQHGEAQAANGLAMRAFYLSPGPDTQDTLGWSLVKLGKPDAALPVLAQAAAALPSPAIMYHYAVALQANGRTGDAKAALAKALSGGKPFDERNEALALQARIGP